MILINYYNAIAYENDLTEKARDDSFEPTTVPSKRFKIWRAVLDIKNYYISREQLEALGWDTGDRPSKFAPGKMLGGNIYDNGDRKLPHKIGRIWREADINYTPGRRNMHRILWSNDGLIFVTYDHYHTFYEIT